MKIIHLADIHIKQSRFKEYELVFNKLKQQIKLDKPDYIVVCGDIFDKSDNITNDEIILYNHFLECCSPYTTIVIPGNHDVNGISNALNGRKDYKHVIYSKSTEVIKLPGVDFYHYSCYDEKRNINHDISNKLNICLMHETIPYVVFPGCDYKDYIYPMINNIETRDYKQFDATMLGDIHKRDIWGNVAYPGSLIQQKRNEHPIEHGYLLWEFKNGITITERNIINPMGIQVSDKFINEINEYKSLGHTIKKVHIKREINEIPEELKDYDVNLEIKRKLKMDINFNIKDTFKDYDNKYLEECWDKLSDKKELTPNKWVINKLKWKNMYVFKGEHEIDICDLCIITGPNKMGKSSMMDILYAALFGKNIRGNKEDIINKDCTSAYSKVHFNIDDDNYMIHRSFSKKSRCVIYKNEQKLKVKRVEAFLESLIGTKITYNVCNYYDQSDVSNFFSLDNNKKKKFLSEFLYLPDNMDNSIKKIREDLNVTRKVLQNDIYHFNNLKKHEIDDLPELSKVDKPSIPKLEHIDCPEASLYRTFDQKYLDSLYEKREKLNQLTVEDEKTIQDQIDKLSVKLQISDLEDMYDKYNYKADSIKSDLKVLENKVEILSVKYSFNNDCNHCTTNKKSIYKNMIEDIDTKKQKLHKIESKIKKCLSKIEKRVYEHESTMKKNSLIIESLKFKLSKIKKNKKIVDRYTKECSKIEHLEYIRGLKDIADNHNKQVIKVKEEYEQELIKYNKNLEIYNNYVYNKKLKVINDRLIEENITIDKKLKLKEDKEKQLEEVMSKLEAYRIIKDITDVNSKYFSSIIEHIYLMIIDQCNKVLNNILVYEDNEIKLSNGLSINSASGFQKFIINLCLRETFIELRSHTSPMTNILILDEKLSVCDDGNLNNIINNILPHFNLKLFIITHKSILKNSKYLGDKKINHLNIMEFHQ